VRPPIRAESVTIATRIPDSGASLSRPITSAIATPAALPGEDGAINVYFVQSFEPNLLINTYPTFPPASSPTISKVPYANVPLTIVYGAVGGASPYAWTVVSGLPDGWTQTPNPANGTFTISGTPTQAGNIILTVKVTDNDSTSGTAAQTQTLITTLPVAAAPQKPPKSVGPNAWRRLRRVMSWAFPLSLGDWDLSRSRRLQASPRPCSLMISVRQRTFSLTS
jgi:hypothetical protein